MGAVGEESLEVPFRVGDGIRRGHTDDTEALRVRLREKSFLERGRIAQKSRSA
jgi:hypothetical protein